MVDCRTVSGWTSVAPEASVESVGDNESAAESAINPSSQALQAFNYEVNQFYARHEVATILKSQFPSLKSTTGGFNVLGMNFIEQSRAL